MNRDILLPTLLLLVQLAVPLVNAITCPTTPTYNSTLNPVCGANDLFVKLPDYTNPSAYYECLGNQTPVLNTCSVNLIFCYVLQKCTTCDDYIPAPPCENLKSQSSANCVDVNSETTSRTTRTTASTIIVESTPAVTPATTPSTTPTTPATTPSLPTPYYPDSTPSVVTPTVVTPSTGDTSEPTSRTTRTTAETTPGIPTAPTPSPSTPGSGIPTPETDTSVAPNFPTVPAAPETPIVVTPPIQD